MTPVEKSRLIKPMTDELATKLEHSLGNLAETRILEGLEPSVERLSGLFGAGLNEAQNAALARFCLAYIRLVPEQSDLLLAAGRTLNVAAIVEPYIQLATRYIDSACEELASSAPKDDVEVFLILLQGAYIFGRMQEELDDKIETFVGVPLDHINMMEANLIVHELLGDNFANRLDNVVTSLVQQSKVTKTIIEASLDQTQTEHAKRLGHSLTGQEVESFAARYGFSMAAGLL